MAAGGIIDIGIGAFGVYSLKYGPRAGSGSDTRERIIKFGGGGGGGGTGASVGGGGGAALSPSPS